ncbi:MAG: 3-oxoacyl-[acyl-carrier-protein] reductase [Pyramidobacter sp.]|nr:3-oxoacyl-[acyl-carrier-protein] reductase [Pyramidobacter sp.]
MARVALVTGAGRGIGRAVAKRLAEDGCAVAVNYRSSAEAAQALVEEITAAGGTAQAFAGDVSDPEAVKKLFEDVKNALGPVEILVNNAGRTQDGLLMRMKDTDWDNVLDADLKSVFLCTREAIRNMVRAKWGRIINISSVVGLTGNPGQANYGAAKAGVIGFSKCVAREYAAKGVTVNCVAPGYIATDMTKVLPDAAKQAILSGIPQGHQGAPEDVANAVSFFAQDSSSYITGQVLAVDGGMTMA